MSALRASMSPAKTNGTLIVYRHERL